MPRCTGAGCDHVLCIEHRRLEEEHYPHMCRDGHEQIGHRDGENEMCPLCRALAEVERLRETLAAVKLAAQWNPWNTQDAHTYDPLNDPRD